MANTTKPTRVPGLQATLPANIDPALRNQINAMVEALEIRLGRRGDPLDRAVTLRELVQAGLATELQNRAFDPNQPRATFQSPTAYAVQTIPPQPTGVSASGGYSIISVFWDYPLYANHSQTQIYRSTTDVVGDALLIGTSGGRSYVDSVGQSANYYYWVRHVSDSGVPGPFHASSGEHATTATDVATLLSVLTGAVTSSQLAAALSTRIDLIDASSATVGSVNERIANESADRVAYVDAAAATLQAQINDLIGVSAYDNATAYVLNDLVTSGGNLYRCILATTGNAPPNATYWELLGAYESLSDVVAANTAAIVELNTVSAGSTSANAAALYALVSEVGDVTTGLSATRATLISDYYTSAETDTAISSATSSLASTSYVASQLANYTTTASLTTNYYTKTATDAAISSATSSLASTTYVATQLANYTTTASLTSNYYTKTATDSAISAAVTGLASTTYVATQLANYTTTASLTTNYYTKTATDSAIAAAVTGLASTTYVTTQLANYVTTATLTSGYYTETETDSAIAAAVLNLASTSYVAAQLANYTTTASLTANYYTKTATDSAIAAAVLNLASTTYVTTQLGNYTTTADLTTNYYTKTATDSAISSATSTLVSTSTLNTALGAYTTTAALELNYYTQAEGALLEAQYMVKIDLNGHVSGFGLFSDNTAGSEFIILADRFSIVSPSSSTTISTPFIVQATETTVGGETVPAGIYIDDAFIMNGTIANAKIADAAIDDAKIANLSADKITAGTISTSRLNIDGATLISDAGVLTLGTVTAAHMDADSVNTSNLVAGSITTEKLYGAAVQNVLVSEVTTSNGLPTDASFETVDEIIVTKEISDSLLVLDYQVTVSATGANACMLSFRVYVDGTLVSPTFYHVIWRDSLKQTLGGKVVLNEVALGARTVTLKARASATSGETNGVSGVTAHTVMFISSEIKR